MAEATEERRACPCGCAEELARGSRFRMGHDARLRGELTRRYRAGDEAALEEARQYGEFWVQAVARVPKQKAAAKPKPAERTTIKVGRWEYEAEVQTEYGDGRVFVHYTDRSGNGHSGYLAPDGRFDEVVFGQSA
jgi:hypothetical protein